MCAFCESHKNDSAVGQDDIKRVQMETHRREVKLSRLEKEADKNTSKERGDKLVAVFDLQAVFPLPSGNTSQFFTKVS